MALRQDIESEKKESQGLKPRKPIRAPLALNSPPEHLTVADSKWLKEMLIAPEDGSLQ